MDIEKVKRYSLVEVAFLAIFMIGLFTAHLIVKARSRVVLSELIAVPGSGLSVAMPTGPGWDQSGAWRYEESENGMTLVGQFRGPGHSGITVCWRYLFSTPAGSEQELLKQQAQQLGAIIQDFNTIGKAHPMTYARMLLPAARREGFCMGVVRLDAHRSVELLVKASGMNGFYEESVFTEVAESIQYQALQEMADGRALMDTFLQSRTESLPRPDEAFLIKDVTGANRGYYVAHHSLSGSDDQRRYRMQIRWFEYNAWELESQLWLSPENKEYRWQTNSRTPQMRHAQVYEIAPDTSGALWVKADGKEIKRFPAGQFLLPEPLLPELAKAFLESEYSGVIVDVLAAKGQMTPVWLKKIPPAEAKAKSEAVNAVVRVDFLYHPDSYEELFFDESRNFLGKFEQQPGHRPRIWDAVSVEELQRLFKTDFRAAAETVAWNR